MFTAREAKMAKEVFVTSALLPVMSIIKWDLVTINDGYYILTLLL